MVTMKDDQLPPGSRVAGYARVSSDRQVAKGESLVVQEQLLRAEATRRGWKIAMYVEEGVSAKDENRPEYQRLRADLATGRLDALLVYKLDRLWRSKLARQLDEVEYVTKTCGRHLLALTQSIDTTTAAGRLALNTLLSVAAYERENLAERIVTAMLARARNGKPNCGQLAYGLRRTGTNAFAIDEAEAAVVRQIFEAFLKRRTVRGVCIAMNDAGARTRAGKAWCHRTVRRVLTSPLYIGDMVYNKKDTSSGKAKLRPAEEHVRVPGVVPAIVDRDTFDAAQALLAVKSPFAPRRQASPYLLSGVVKCGRCGAPLNGHRAWSGRGERKNQLPYYRCWKHVLQGDAVCKGVSIRADVLERAIIESLRNVQLKPAKLRALARAQQVRLRDRVTPLHREVARLEGAAAKLAGRRARIMAAYEDGVYTKALMQERLAQCTADAEKTEAALAAARQRLADATLATFDPEKTVQQLTDGLAVFERYPFAHRQRFIRDVVGEIVVRPDGVQFTLLSGRSPDSLFARRGPETRFITFGHTDTPARTMSASGSPSWPR